MGKNCMYARLHKKKQKLDQDSNETKAGQNQWVVLYSQQMVHFVLRQEAPALASGEGATISGTQQTKGNQDGHTDLSLRKHISVPISCSI